MFAKCISFLGVTEYSMEINGLRASCASDNWKQRKIELMWYMVLFVEELVQELMETICLSELSLNVCIT